MSIIPLRLVKVPKSYHYHNITVSQYHKYCYFKNMFTIEFQINKFVLVYVSIPYYHPHVFSSLKTNKLLPVYLPKPLKNYPNMSSEIQHINSI